MLRGMVIMAVVAVVALMVVVVGEAADATTPAKHETKMRFRRDYGGQQDPETNDPPPADDSGFYYYYYPVEEGGKVKDKGKGSLGYKDEYYKCSEEKLLAPLIIICIFLGIIAFRDIGLVPSFNLPTIELPTIDIPDIDLPDVEINRGRNLASSISQYIPWGSLNNATVAVLAAVEAEECLPWLVCESGRLAQDRSTTLSLMELFAPRKYQPQVKIFKDAALLKTSCGKYKCSTFKKPMCTLLEALGGRC